MPQQHGRRSDGAHRIRDALPCDVRRRAVHRLEQTGAVTDRGRGQQSQRAGEYRRLVAQNVAEQVLRDDHVERCGIGHQPHRRVVDVKVLQRNVRVVGRDPGNHVPPELRYLEHVGLVD